MRAHCSTLSVKAERAGAALVVTPELSLCGYPPEDLLLRPAFLDACASELAALAAQVRGTTAIVGFPEIDAGVALQRGRRPARRPRRRASIASSTCPITRVFDEQRYFEPGTEPCVVDVDGHSLSAS